MEAGLAGATRPAPAGPANRVTGRGEPLAT